MSLKCAALSPRICADGSIRWYSGDTFTLQFEVNLIGSDGNPIAINEDDVIHICFRDQHQKIVYEFEIVGTTTVDMEFSNEVSKRFLKGEYTYCVRYKGEYITTIMHNNKVVVE